MLSFYCKRKEISSLFNALVTKEYRENMVSYGINSNIPIFTDSEIIGYLATN